jgi:lipopolysaccharide transport system permease protein
MITMQETVIESGRAEGNYYRDLWRYRELFIILAWRDITVRYKQTVVGASWALVRPFITMVVFTIVFGNVAKLPSVGEAPYALMVLAGMLPWTLFSTSLLDASNSLVSNAGLIGKVYFPRMIVPTASIIVAFVDFIISLLLAVVLMVYYQYLPDWRICFLPVFAVLALLASLGPGLYLTAMNVKYRDFRYIIPFIAQFGLYISPVGYATQAVPEKWRLWMYLNPITGVIDGFRWCLLRGDAPLTWAMAISVLVIVFFLWLGVRKFRTMERSFADII